MKILYFLYDHINNPWVGGGAAVRAYEIYKRLSQKGYKITIISGNYPDAKDYKEGNIEFKFLGYKKNYILSTFSYAYYANKYLRNHYKNFDIIIEDFAPWNPIFSNQLQNLKPIILQLHHKEGKNILKKYNIFGFPFYVIEKTYHLKFKNIITVSQPTAKKFNLKNYKIIPNGIDENLLNIKTNIGKYILYIGRIDLYNKGLDLLIDSMESYPLLIVGKGKDEIKLKNLIKEKKNITFKGFVNEHEKIEFIQNSKFVVMPSRFEGQGIVALEAAAIGTPLIVSDIPELEYVVKNGFGISFKSGDAQDLSRKIKYLYNNESLLKKMSANGKEYAKNFSWDKIADEYENYIKQVLYNFRASQSL